MPGFLSTVGSLLPYHLLCYGSLLGSTLYQSFVNTKICFTALSMPEFINLQKRIFPVYFRCQLALVILTAATAPIPLAFGSRPSKIIPLVLVFATSVLNGSIYGPRIIQTTIDRQLQEEKDAKSCKDPNGMSDDMKHVNRRFARDHAMVIHINAIGIVGSVLHAFTLASVIAD